MTHLTVREWGAVCVSTESSINAPHAFTRPQANALLTAAREHPLYLHTSAIIVGDGQVLSAVNDVNDYAGPATGYRLQGERWEEIKNIPGALDPNELG